MGARLRCASATMRTICARSVSAPTRSACTMNEPAVLTVPAVTLLPFCFSTGMGSPVIIDSSMTPEPSTTTPSIAILSPGRTRMRMPGLIDSIDMSCSLPCISTRAVLGVRRSRARIAPEVRSRACNSSTWPRRTSVVMTAAASK